MCVMIPDSSAPHAAPESVSVEFSHGLQALCKLICRSPFMERRETVETFRARLTQVLRHSELSLAAFAQAVGMDRSTLSQLLAPNNDRLPRVDSLAGIAQ